MGKHAQQEAEERRRKVQREAEGPREEHLRPAWPADQDREGAGEGEESGGSLAEGSEGAEDIGLPSPSAGREAASEAGRGICGNRTGAGSCADGSDGFGSTSKRANDRRQSHGAGRDVERRPVTRRGSRPRTDRNLEQDESATPRRPVLS